MEDLMCYGVDPSYMFNSFNNLSAALAAYYVTPPLQKQNREHPCNIIAQHRLNCLSWVFFYTDNIE